MELRLLSFIETIKKKIVMFLSFVFGQIVMFFSFMAFWKHNKNRLKKKKAQMYMRFWKFQ